LQNPWITPTVPVARWLGPALAGLKDFDRGFCLRWLEGLALRAPGGGEAEQAALLEAAPLGISLTRRERGSFGRRLVAANRACARMAGRDRTQLLTVGDARLLQARAHEPSHSSRLQICVELGLPYRGRAAWLGPDGRRRPFEYVAVPLCLDGQLLVAGFDRPLQPPC
jgi:PAS domain-containing protein